MKSSLLLLLLLVLPVFAVHAQGDEPDLAVSPKGAGAKRANRPHRKKPETQEAKEATTPAPPESRAKKQRAPRPESRPVIQKHAAGIQIDREAKKITTPKISFLPTKTSVGKSAIGDIHLTPVSQKILRGLAQELSRESDLQVKIEVHTDEIGSDRFNVDLSQHQADAVKAFLVDSGIAATRLQAVGKGDAEPLDEDHTPLAQSKNRRVEFVITGARPAEEKPPETIPVPTPTVETMPKPSFPTQPESLPTAETRPETRPSLPIALPPPSATPSATIPVVSLPVIPTSPETRPQR